MQIPSLPTDNFYKFAFIAGLLMIFVPFILLGSETINLSTEIARQSVKTDSIIEAKYKLEQLSENVDSQLGNRDQRVIELEEKVDQLKEELAVIGARLDAMWAKIIAGAVLMSLGVFVTRFAGKNWYTKTQVKQDQLLEIQVQKATIELEVLLDERDSKKGNS